VTGPYRDCAGLHVSRGDDAVLRIVIDRTDKRNALDDEMVMAMSDAIDAAERDEHVRAVLLSGEGDHFCGGFDIIGRNAGGGDRRPRAGSIQRRLPSQAHRLVPLFLTVQVPIVCAVRGWAAGIGLHLALAADFAVAAEDARFWEPFIERGFTPDSGGTWLLPRRVGDVRAREMLLLGRALDGREAAGCGLVHAAVPAAQLMEEAEALTTRLATGPTVAIGLTKWLLARGASLPLDAHLRDEAFGVELSSRSEDFREGMAAFTEKRPPRFIGR